MVMTCIVSCLVISSVFISILSFLTQIVLMLILDQLLSLFVYISAICLVLWFAQSLFVPVFVHKATFIESSSFCLLVLMPLMIEITLLISHVVICPASSQRFHVSQLLQSHAFLVPG